MRRAETRKKAWTKMRYEMENVSMGVAQTDLIVQHIHTHSKVCCRWFRGMEVSRKASEGFESISLDWLKPYPIPRKASRNVAWHFDLEVNISILYPCSSVFIPSISIVYLVD